MDALTGCLTEEYRGIAIVGAAKVAPGTEADDMLVNAINGGEADCVIAILTPPVQEQFIARNRSQINTRVWLGAGKLMEFAYRQKSGKGKVMTFLDRMLFRREIEKTKKES